MTTKTKYTAGPWRTDDGNRVSIRAGAARVAVANREANARLIAAGPELVDALRELHLAVTMRPSGYQSGLSQAERIALDKARALLARIDGKA